MVQAPFNSVLCSQNLRKTRLFCLIVAAVLLLPSIATACDLCAIYTAEHNSKPEKGQFLFAATTQYIRYEATPREYAAVSDLFLREQSLDSYTTQLLGRYQALDRLWLQATLPYIAREYSRIERGRYRKGDEHGFGDLSLLLGVDALQYEQGSRRFQLQLYSGIKLPTGSDDRLAEEQEESTAVNVESLLHGTPDGSLVSGAELALGTGSFDIPLGLNLHAAWKDLFLQAQAQYIFRTEGGYDFEYGDSIYFSAGPGVYLLSEHELVISAALLLSGDFKDEDRLSGERFENSDQNRLFLGPSLRFHFKRDLAVELSYQHSVHDDDELEGVQPKHRIQLAASLRF